MLPSFLYTLLRVVAFLGFVLIWFVLGGWGVGGGGYHHYLFIYLLWLLFGTVQLFPVYSPVPGARAYLIAMAQECIAY